jgi:hypothetical protein
MGGCKIMANWEYFDENDNKINVQQSSSNWEYFDENDKPIQTTQQPVVNQQPVQNTPAQPQVVQDTPVQSQTVQNNDGSYTLKTGIQKKSALGKLKNAAKFAIGAAIPGANIITNWDKIYNKGIKPGYEAATKWLWHKGGQGLRAALPKKALLPFLSEDWWFGTDEQNARLKQLDEVARQTGYYDQNAVRNDFMKGKLSRRQANAYAQMVGERENLLQDLNYIKGDRGGNTAEGIVTVSSAAFPGGSFKTAGGVVGKLGFNALKNANASKNLALGGGKVARYLTQHGLRGGQIGAEMAVLKNTYENMAGIEHDPFAKELADNMLLAAGADIALPIAFKGAGAVGKRLGKGIEAGANKWENTANQLINNPYSTDLQRGIGQTMNSIGGAATNLGATAKRFLTSDLNKVNVLGSRVNRKAKLDNALAELANEDAHLRNINPEVLRELADISDEASQETINALLKGVDLDGNPLEPSEAYKSIMNIINEARIKKGLQPHEYSNGWKEPSAEPSIIPEATPEYQYPVADVEDTILLRKTGLIDDNELVNDLSEAGLDSEQILQIMEENGFANKPITPEAATKTPTVQNSPVNTNDTEALVGKLNELNGYKTNTGNSKYDEWIAKNKQKHAEGSGSHVKSETDINTHEVAETPQNEPASHVNENNAVSPKRLYEIKQEIEQQLDRPYSEFKKEYGDSADTELKKLLNAKERIDNEIAKSKREVKKPEPQDEGNYTYEENWKPVKAEKPETNKRITKDGWVEVKRKNGTIFRYRKIERNNVGKPYEKLDVNGEYGYIPKAEGNVTKLEPGDAEGSHTSMRDLSLERPDKVETHTGGDKPSEYKGEIIDEVYNAGSHVNEEVPLTNRYASDDAEFNKWFDKYEKADSETRIKMQKEKMTDFNSQEESMDFYEKFTEQVDRDKRIAERNQTSPSVTEDDIMNFASNYKAADILPKGKVPSNTSIEKVVGHVKKYSDGTINRKDLAKKLNSMFIKQNSTKDIDALYNKIKDTINDDYTYRNLLDATRDYAYYSKMAAGRSKALRRMSRKGELYNKTKNEYEEFQKLRDDAFQKIQDLSKKEYKGNFRKSSTQKIVFEKGKPVLKNKSIEETNKIYPYKNKTVLGIDIDKAFLEQLDAPRQNQLDDVLKGQLSDNNTKLQSRFIDGELVTANPSKKYKKIDFSKTHKVKDYAEDLSSGNKYVKAFLKNSDIEFAFENMGGHGWTDAKTYKHFKLNINESLEDTLIAGKHEVGHIIQKAISEFDPEMAQIIRETEIANDKFFKACKEVPENKIKEFIDWDNLTEKELNKKLEKLSETEQNKFWEITDKYFDYKYSEGEQLAQQASKGDYSGYGEENLRELYNRTVRTNKQGNNANKRRKTTDGKTEGNKGNEQGIGDSFGSVFDFSNEGRQVNRPSSKQPVGLKFLREQTENTYKETAKDFDVKKGTIDKNYLNKYINDIKTKANDAENASRKRHLATDEQILGRLEMTGADTYLAPTQKKLAEEKATFTLEDIKNVIKETLTGESSISRTDKVKEVFGHKQSHTERVRSLQQQYVNTELRKAKVLGVDKVLNEVESMPETVPVKDGKILPGNIGIKQGIMANTLATGRGKDFYKLLDEGNPDKIMQAFIKPEHLEIDKAASENLRTKFPDLFDSKGNFRINSKLDPEIMLKKTPEAKQAYRAARHFIEIANMEKEYTYQVPKHIYDTLCGLDNEKVLSAYKHYGLTKGTVAKAFGALVDVPTNLFKRAVLSLSTNWNIGNRINNPVLMYAHEKSVGSLLKHYKDAFKLKQSDLPPELFDNNLFEASKLRDTLNNITGNQKVDAWLGLLSGNSVGKGYINNGIGKVLKATTLPRRMLFKIGDANMKLNEMFENFERKVAYAKQLDDLADRNFCKNVGGNIIKQTMTLSEKNSAVLKNPQIRKFVVDRVQDTLGDFSMMTPMEKNICKRVFPFYAWLRTINRSIYKLASDNPTKALMMLKTINDIKEDDIYHKEWQKGSIDIDHLIDKLHLPIKHPKLTRDGSKTVINPMKYLNYYDTHEEMARPGSGLNPFANNIIEAAIGKSLFTGRTLNSKRYVSVRMGNKDALFDSKTNKFLKDKEGNLTDKLPASARLAKAGVGIVRLNIPEMNSSLVDIEKALSIGLNKRSKDTWKSQAGNAIEFDKKYDDSFGGFSHDDLSGYYQNKKGEYKTVKRFASSKYNKKGQMSRHFTSLIQEELPLNKEEKIIANYKKRERDKRIAAWKTRNNKKK